MRLLIENELRTLLLSPEMERAPALSRLLRFLVEEQLAGRGPELKESVIGHALYRRPADYDTKLDSVVRVNANRLRFRLEDYYSRNPASEFRIVLRKGSYTPLFEEVDREQSGLAPISFPSLGPLPEARNKVRIKFLRPRVVWAVTMALVVLTWAILMLRNPSSAAATAYWSARPLSHLGGSQAFPALSPDGKELLFTWTPVGSLHSWIYVQNLGTGGVTRLSSGSQDESRPAWSSDGSQVAFIHFQQGEVKKDVVVHEMRTGAERVVGELDGSYPWLCSVPKLSWSRDGTEIFTVTPPPGKIDCRVIALNIRDGTHHWLTQTKPESQGDLEVSVNPRDNEVAYLRLMRSGLSEVFHAAGAGGSEQRLPLPDQEMGGLEWARTGRAVIVSLHRGSEMPRLWSYDMSGHTIGPLTDGTSVAAFPSTTPDGSKVVFTKYDNTAAILQLNEGRGETLVSDQSRNSNPRTSPDGKYFLYSSDRTGLIGIYGSDWTRSHQWRITQPGANVGSSATWSPDGRSVAYECRGELSNICVIAGDGSGGVHQMTRAGGNNILPSWSHDGAYLYYSSDRRGSWQIYRQSISTHAEMQITFNGGKRALESLDGTSLFVHRGDPSGGILRIPLTGRYSFSEEGGVLLPQLKASDWSEWDVAPGGLFFVKPDKAAAYTEIDYMNLSTGDIKEVEIARSVPSSSMRYFAVGSGLGRFLLDQNSDVSEIEIIERNLAQR